MSKKTFKCVSLLLVLFLIFASLIGCSGGKTDQNTEQKDEEQSGEDVKGDQKEPEEQSYDFGGRTFRTAAWWDSEPKEGTSQSADELIARIRELSEKYNCKLEYLNIPWDQYLERVTSTTLAGDPFADYFYISSSWFWPTLVTGGMLYPLDDLGIFDFNDPKWNQQVISLGTYEGKKYAITTGRPEPRAVFFFNKTLFDREGIPYLYDLQKNKQWNWDKMLEIAKKTTKDLDGDGVIDQWGVTGDIGWSLVYTNGAQAVKYENGKYVVGLTDSAALEALQFWQDLLYVHKVAPLTPEGAEWGWETNMFQNGKAAMLFGDFWLGDQFNPNMEDDYGIVLPPMGPRATGYVSKAWDNVMEVIPSTAKNPVEIAIFYDALTDPLPSATDPDQAWLDGWEGRVRDRESLEALIPIRDENITVFHMWDYIGELQQMGWTFMAQIQNNEKTPQAAIGEIAQQAQAVLDEVANK